MFFYNEVIANFINQYIYNSPLNLTSVLSPALQSYAMSSIYDDSSQKYYIAAAQSNIAGNNGIVKIFSSSNSVNWSSAIATYNGGTDAFLGTEVKLLSSSYGLYCFISAYSGSAVGQSGSIHYVKSTNGATWSTLTQIESGSTNSRFGNSFDVLYDDLSNKFILVVGAQNQNSNRGHAFCITSSDGTSWSTKQQIMSGNGITDYIGDSVAIVSCSSGYQAYAAGRAEDFPIAGIGNIYVVTSSDALNWSNQIIIASGTANTGSNTAGITNLGVGAIRAVNFNNKSYLFFAETLYDTGSLSGSDNGAVFVVSSSNNNYWASSDIYSEKIMIASGSNSGDTIPQNSTTTKTLDVKIYDNKIYYAFGAPLANTANVDAGKVYLGSSSDGLTWQKYVADQQDMTVFTGSVTNNFFGRSISILSSSNYLNLYTNNTSSIFYTNIGYKQNI